MLLLVTALHKGWFLLRKYLLTIPRFDLFLQGALLIVVFLESYIFLLLRRSAGTGYLRAINEDWVQLGVGGAEFLFGTMVAWYGRGMRHFALSGWLGATAVSGLIVLAFPFAESLRPSVELCGGGAISGYSELYPVPVEDTLLVPRMLFLILTAILCALTKISVWAHGVTYLDDHEPENGPYFYGILISIRLSLGLSGQNWMRSVSVRDDWWEAQVSLSMLTLMFSILFTLFPRRMEGYKEFDEKEYNCILKPIGRMLQNKALMIQTLALSLLNTAVFGYVNFDTASIQAKFHVETLRQDPRTVRTIMDIFRSLVIIFFVSIFRMRFSIRRSDGVKSNTASKVGGVVCVLVTAFFCVLAALHCNTGPIDGFKGGEYQQPACSVECGCGSEKYGFAPICILNTSTTYFSPCHAGCQQYEDLNGFLLFDECKCGPQRAVRGSCTLPECWLAYSIYLVFFTMVLAASAASLLMQGMSVLRAVPKRDKPIAVGVSFALMGLISHVLGHFIYMIIGYFTCAYDKDDICLMHNYSIWTIGLASAVLSILSGVVSIIASRYPPATESDDLATSDININGR